MTCVKKMHYCAQFEQNSPANCCHSTNASGNFCEKKMLKGNENPEDIKTRVTNVMCDYCSWISEILARISAETRISRKKKKRVDPIIIVHGGAGRIPRHARKFMLDEVKKAAISAYRDLIKGCNSLDAVERAICHMESKKYFNCAYGGSLDANGEVVMDAAIMTDDLRAGCVGAVRNIAHPITLAKMVLQQTEHVLIVEAGAQKFALESGVHILSPGQLIVTSDSKTSLHEERNNEAQDSRKEQELLQDGDKQSGKKECIPECVIERHEDKEEGAVSEIGLDESLEIEPDFIQLGAVGAVAFDRKKRLASGTSTAGEPGKLHGIVSATGTAIGCGIYVDKCGSVSVSGCDKAIYKYAPARQILRRLQQKSMSIDEAVAIVLKDFEGETEEVFPPESDVGVIALTGKGIPSVSFKCPHFPWACCDKGYVYYGCAWNEKFSEKIDVLERPPDCVCEDSN